MVRWFRKSIALRFFLAFVLVLVIPFVLISVFTNRIYVNILLNNTSDMILQSMEQIAIGMDNEITRVSLTAATLANDFSNDDDGIMDLVKKWNDTRNAIGDNFIYQKQIDSRLKNIISNNGDYETVTFFFRDGGFYYYNLPPIVNEQEMRRSPWYTNAMKTPAVACIPDYMKSLTVNTFQQNLISVAICPDPDLRRNAVEMIYLGYRTNIFNSFYAGYRMTSQGQLLITDSANTVMISRDRSLIGRNLRDVGLTPEMLSQNNSSRTVQVQGTEKFLSVHYIEKKDWRIISLIDYAALTKEAGRLSLLTGIAVFVFFLLFILFSVYFFRDFLKPLKWIRNRMKDVEEGNLETSIALKRQDEIADLAHSFNTMVREVRNLIRDRDMKERARSKAEIEVLQSHIQPHFLSNTLNAIRLMAMIAKADSIRNMTEALMKLMTALFARSGYFVTVQEETEYLESYIYIMKVRFGDRFNVTLDVAEEIRSACVLRLILQPVLENAILHGVSEMEARGEILVRGFAEDDRLIFEITDNGKGMTEEQIRMLLSDEQPDHRGFSSIGIRNVNQRIRLNHGGDFGLSIESRPGLETCVRLMLPRIDEVREEPHV